jgi:hypothetical protein
VKSVGLLLIALLIPGLVHAQAPRSGSPAPPAARPSTPPPTRPSTPPPIVFPFPPLMPPPAGGLTPGTPFVPTDVTQPPRDLFLVNGRFNPYKPRPFPPGLGVAGGYGGYPVGGAYPTPETTSPWQNGSGLLRLSVTPGSGQVFVDSYYVATVDDIDAQRGMTLPVGPHRVEIRAPDYQTLTFDVRIDPNQTVTYRGALERVVPPAPRAAPTAASTRMYVIPNCYLGNIPPRPDRLPAGCSVKQVRIVGEK